MMNLALLTLLVLRPFAAEPALEGLDAYVRQAMVDWEVPALAISVVKDGEVVFCRGYGILELSKPEAADEHTRFAIGSTTKAMTAAAVGMLVDEKKLSWDDRVTEHLPWFQLGDPVVTREVTVRDLLTHRAGLPNTDFLWYGQSTPSRDLLLRMRHVENEASLRSRFIYQNVMYAAAGALVADVSGTSWEEFVRTRIFEPLGMSGTVATLSELAGQGNVATPHDRLDGEVRAIENASVDSVAAAGSVWSSASDMAKWMRFLLEGRTADGRRLLEEETLSELFRPQVIVDRDAFYPTQRLTKPHWTTYGLGWFQHDYDGRAVDFHTGSIDGMVAIHGLVRHERLGVFVLANLDHAELRHALMYRVFDFFGKGASRDWSRELRELYRSLAEEAEAKRAEAEKDRVPGTSPSLPLERYPGTYSDPLLGKISVTRGERGLRLSYGPGLEGDLEHWHHDVFRVAWGKKWRGGGFVSFRLDVSGEIASVELDGRSFRRDASVE